MNYLHLTFDPFQNLTTGFQDIKTKTKRYRRMAENGFAPPP